MIWAILALLGVPLWLLALGLAAVVLRNRALRRRPGNVIVRLRRPGRKHFSRGNGVWVHDVFAFRGSPAAWKETLLWAEDLTLLQPSVDELHRLRRLGPSPFVASIGSRDGPMEVACSAEDAVELAGPFMQRP